MSRCVCGGHYTVRSGRRGAFSLVELLVITAAIAILLSILMPSLRGAREQALKAVCAGQLHGVQQAAAAYHSHYSEWLPGSPGTTGGALLGKYQGSPGAREDMPAAPVQIWDYAGPLAAEYMNMSLPPSRPARYGAVTGGPFLCPANRVLSLPFLHALGEVGKFHIQAAVSFTTVRNFLMWPKREVAGRPWGPEPPFYAMANPAGWDGNIDGASGTVLPAGFTPRLPKLGAPAEKVFLADGARFMSYQGVSHNVHWRGSDVGGAAGGAFADGGPSLRDDLLRSYWFDEPQRSYAYRHPRGRAVGVTAAYFDGHADWMSERESRRPDFWWPKGTVVPVSEMNPVSAATLGSAVQPGGAYTVPR